MRSLIFVFALAAATGLAAGGCTTDGPGGPDTSVLFNEAGQPLPDSGVGRDGSVWVDDQGVPHYDGSVLPTGSIKAAAIQYGPGMFTYAPGCTDDNCGVKYFVEQAAQQGATHILVPEALLGIAGASGGILVEPTPAIGANPSVDPPWSTQETVLGTFSKLADDLNVTVIVHLYTEENNDYYSTIVALGPDGKVLGRHYKYYLYAGEGDFLTPGTECCDLFDTPAGQAGLLICADINCIPTMEIGGSNCTTLNYTKLQEFFAKKPYIAFISTFWMAWKSDAWQAINVFSKFAKLSGAYTVGANNIATFTPGCSGTCKGGGIFRPDGTAIDSYDLAVPGIAIGEIPKQGSPPPPPPPPPPPSDLVITEFMANPAAVSDGAGEYVEIYNAGSAAVDLQGFKIADAADTHTIGASVVVAPGSYVVLGVDASTATNGGTPVAYDYGTLSLNNTGDTIQILDTSGAVVDQVNYLDTWGVTSGASLSLKDPALDNAVGSNWCVETAAWSGSAGDLGSPGAAAGCN